MSKKPLRKKARNSVPAITHIPAHVTNTVALIGRLLTGDRVFFEGFRTDAQFLAHRLAYSCHLGGLTVPYYSVAQHCGIAAYLAEQHLPKNRTPFSYRQQAFFIDAYQAYLPALPGQIYMAYPELRMISEYLRDFREPAPYPTRITGLMQRLLRTEAQLFPYDEYRDPKPAPVLQLGNPPKFVIPLAKNGFPIEITPFTPERAELMWLEIFDIMLNQSKGFKISAELVGARKLSGNQQPKKWKVPFLSDVRKAWLPRMLAEKGSLNVSSRH